MKEFQNIVEKYVEQYKNNRSKIERRDTIRCFCEGRTLPSDYWKRRPGAEMLNVIALRDPSEGCPHRRPMWQESHTARFQDVHYGPLPR